LSANSKTVYTFQNKNGWIHCSSIIHDSYDKKYAESIGTPYYATVLFGKIRANDGGSGQGQSGGGSFFSTTDSLLAVGGMFADALEARSNWNATIVYKYGTKALSNTELTAINGARMGRYAKIAGAAGNTLGLASIALNIAEDISKDNLGWGTMAKTGIGTASLLFPGFGLAYGLVDVMTLATTRTSLTNHIGNAVDNQFK
jgi:hypothetical protein